MRRELVTWSVVLGIILAAFGIVVLVLNATLYSASGFVRGYLDALERQDADSALTLIGPAVPTEASELLLRPDAMGSVSEIALVSETVGPEGTHRVVFSFVAGERSGQSAFEVRRTGAILGLFSTWEFASSPLAVMHVVALNDARFTVNGVELVSPSPNEPAPYLVFAPGSYLLEHESGFLEAKPVPVIASTPGGSIPTAINAMPNQAFLDQVEKEVHEYLDDCATQQVLQPTGCPFGQVISNRVASVPQWSIADYPEIRIEPTGTAGEWRMPRTSAAAHLRVDVRSLFDGTIREFDDDVPFTVSYLITFLSETELLISADYAR